MENVGNIVEELGILRDESDEFLEQMVLLGVNLTKLVDFVLHAHLPALVKELKELLDLWLGQLVKYLVRLEVLYFPDDVLPFDVEFSEFFGGVPEAPRVYELREG